MAEWNDADNFAAKQALPYLQKTLKAEVYQKTIEKVARDLNKRDRSFSRIVHAPIIEPVSNSIAYTLMRPAGIVGGGIVSLAGTVTLLYLANTHGLEYSFSVYILLFMCGYFIGLAIEGLLSLIKRR